MSRNRAFLSLVSDLTLPRDIEFDLEYDRERCLHGLNPTPLDSFNPVDVQRVTQIFDNPQFFVDGAQSNDIVQGGLGDCWFLSALATMSTASGLVEKFCVAVRHCTRLLLPVLSFLQRDEEVGVYGFIFFRDSNWVTVIIDEYAYAFSVLMDMTLNLPIHSLLYTEIPKFEELTYAERVLYHHDKDKYNLTARKGGKSLYFARSGTPGETWVPLIEKAFAKLHGDYQSLSGGYSAEAIEDLTGYALSCLSFHILQQSALQRRIQRRSEQGYCFFRARRQPVNLCVIQDILDPERFWKEELLNANKDRLFGCAFDSLNPTRSGEEDIKINGLMGGHSYSVLRAIEHNDKKFVIIRNPWGRSEWTGAWSDGSKEWNAEWMSALPVLGHLFGEDGQFVMECESPVSCCGLEFTFVLERSRLPFSFPANRSDKAF